VFEHILVQVASPEVAMPATPLAQPVLFVSHGAPTLALDGGDWAAALAGWSRTLGGVQALLVMSAHWEAPGPVRVTTSPQPGTLHDFSGFPERLYHLQYPAPGDPALAGKVLDLLREGGVEAMGDAQRPLDHGTWVPLGAAFPEARIPVVQVSLPVSRTPSQVFHLGRLLRPLRQEGVLVAGSGGVVHNLRLLDWTGRRGPEDWALGFEAWMAGRVARKDLTALFQAAREAPAYARAVPTSEHLDPLYFALGAAGDGELGTLYEGWQLGSLSLRTWTWEGGSQGA
jgi:4,5-DOPA dioxygenase extradiol